MTSDQHSFLLELEDDSFSKAEVFARLGVNLDQDTTFLCDELRAAISGKEGETIDLLLNLFWHIDSPNPYLPLLNELISLPGHNSHQFVVRLVQKIGHPDSLPFIRKALESDFAYLEYTASEHGVIAKWFSWALFAIGTSEAIEMIREFAQSPDSEIREEMQYRLKKVEKRS